MPQRQADGVIRGQGAVRGCTRQLETAATKVGNDAVNINKATDHTTGGIHGLFNTFKHPDGMSQNSLSRNKERILVSRLTDSFGCENINPVEIAMPDNKSKSGQRRKGMFNPVWSEMTRFSQPFAKAADFAFVELRDWQSPASTIDHQTNGVGPDIDKPDTCIAIKR